MSLYLLTWRPITMTNSHFISVNCLFYTWPVYRTLKCYWHSHCHFDSSMTHPIIEGKEKNELWFKYKLCSVHTLLTLGKSQHWEKKSGFHELLSWGLTLSLAQRWGVGDWESSPWWLRRECMECRLQCCCKFLWYSWTLFSYLFVYF